MIISFTMKHIFDVAFGFPTWYNLLATQTEYKDDSWESVFLGKNAFSTLLSPWIVKGLRRGNRSSAFFGCGTPVPCPFCFKQKSRRRPSGYGSRFVSSKYGELKKSEMLIFKPWQISWIKRSLTESYAQFTMFPIEDFGTPLFI